MPCVNSSNGQPVPGVQGQCPMGSTWREPTGWFGRDQMSDEDKARINQETSIEGMMNRQPLMDKPDWMPDWGVDAGIIAAGVLGGGRNPGSKNAMWQSMKNMGTRLKDSKLMDKLFKSNKKQYNKDGSQKNVPGEPIYKNVRPNWNTKLKQWEFRGKKINPQTWNGGKGVNSTQRVRVGTNPKLDPKGNPIPVTARDWSKGKIGTYAAGTAAIPAIEQLMNKMGGVEQKSSPPPPAPPPNADEVAAKAEATRVAGLNPLESMLENMKKKGFWTDPINKDGPKTDTKLNRLGILMDYYGKDPVQRAASTSPSEQFAQSDKNYADLQEAFAKAQAELHGDSYNWSYANVEKSLGDWFDKKFGTDWWGVGKDRGASKKLFLTDVTDAKALFPNKSLMEVAEAILKDDPDKYK